MSISDEQFIRIRHAVNAADVDAEFGTYALRERTTGIGTGGDDCFVYVDFVKLDEGRDEVGYFDTDEVGLVFRVHREKRSKYNGFSKGLQSEGIPWGKI